MKEKINIYNAQELLMQSLDKKDFGDRVYEFAQEQYQNAIAVIEQKYDITDVDGQVITEEDSHGEQEWYDEVQEMFYQKVYDRTLEFLTQGE